MCALALKAGIVPTGTRYPFLHHSVQSGVSIRSRTIARADINTDDTPGVSSLLDRDFKIIELNEDAFAEVTPVDKVETNNATTIDTQQPQRQQQREVRQDPSIPTTENGPKRSKEAINLGLELFAQEDYAGAIELFQLALELPGSGVMRMSGSPKEYACASEGEEQAALYNMACCYCRMDQTRPALTCIEALLEADFDNFNTLRTDPDLAKLRGPALDALISKYDGGPLAKIFGRKKKEGNGERPWLSW